MTAHTCTTLTDGCYRCELQRDEIAAAQQDMRIEARALDDMADDFRFIGMTEAEALCREKADALRADAS